MPSRLTDRPIVIIEDSDEDFEVILWSLRQAGVTNQVHRCARTADIEDLLTCRSNWPAALAVGYPLLVMLDINMPGSHWRSTLYRFRNSRWWRPVPVVAMSTSQQPATVSACYSMGAAGYLKKSVDLDTFAVTITDCLTYWLHTVVQPLPDEEAIA